MDRRAISLLSATGAVLAAAKSRARRPRADSYILRTSETAVRTCLSRAKNRPGVCLTLRRRGRFPFQPQPAALRRQRQASFTRNAFHVAHLSKHGVCFAESTQFPLTCTCAQRTPTLRAGSVVRGRCARARCCADAARGARFCVDAARGLGAARTLRAGLVLHAGSVLRGRCTDARCCTDAAGGLGGHGAP